MSDKNIKNNNITNNKKNTTETLSYNVNKKYIVTRSGTRVSDLEYDSKEKAKSEYDSWCNVVKRWPDGTKIQIEEFDEKKHKI
jgi:hypothetical protein